MNDNRISTRHAVQIDCDLSRRGSIDVSVRVSDISASGARVTGYHPLSCGERVRLKIGANSPVNANVIWCKVNEYGVSFEYPLATQLVEEIAAAHPIPRHRLLSSDVPAGWSGSMTTPRTPRATSADPQSHWS